ncbi:MAG TPA: enoyl-CoA hydratase/isomerase family protein [Gemmatimonadales bacterium]|nr:enoyl-CoA hydratase/isomerase family protein [Gemmatimonadales bacterium]
MTAPVLEELHAGVLTLVLNRPEKRNALNAATLDALHAGVERADLEAAVRVVAIRGAGRDFCAGADLQELLASADQPPEENERAAMHLGGLFVRMRQLPKPVVAIVHGRALAGGAGLATACDLVIAAADVQMGYPEIQRGFVPAMVMTLLRRLTGEKLAFDLAATGRVLTAREALEAGLVSRVVANDELDAEAGRVLRLLCEVSPSALALTKRQFYELDGLPFAEGVALGARVNALSRSTPDFKRAIAAFLAK